MKCTTNRKIISKLFGRLAWCWICIKVLDKFIMLLKRKNVQRFFNSEPIIYFSHFVCLKNMIFEKSWSKKVAKSNTYILKNTKIGFFEQDWDFLVSIPASSLRTRVLVLRFLDGVGLEAQGVFGYPQVRQGVSFIRCGGVYGDEQPLWIPYG